MYPGSLPNRPAWNIKASLVAGAVLLVLAALLAYIDYEPIAPLLGPEPTYLSVSKAREIEELARDAGQPFRTGLKELLDTASGRNELFDHARAIEGLSNAALAVRVYHVNARAGHGKSAMRLSELYERGAPGVPRDYAESLQWRETARQLGEHVDLCCRR